MPCVREEEGWQLEERSRESHTQNYIKENVEYIFMHL